jgi:hypothetical protein
MGTTTTAQKAVELKRKNPCLTLEAIGDSLGVTRERVRQILQEHGFDTKRRIKTRICAGCGRVYRVSEGGRKYHSRECWKKSILIPVACASCGKIMWHREKHVLAQLSTRGYQRMFCSRACKGQWVGLNRGFGVHPTNAGGVPKYNSSAIGWLYFYKGYQPSRISAILSIPRSAVYNVVYRLRKNR